MRKPPLQDAGGARLSKLSQHANLGLPPAMLASLPNREPALSCGLGEPGLGVANQVPGFPISLGRTVTYPESNQVISSSKPLSV